MRVEIRDDSGELIWVAWRNAGGSGGLTCSTYRTDGTLKHVVSALEVARQQAVGELAVSHDVDGVANIGATPTKVDRDIPVVS